LLLVPFHRHGGLDIIFQHCRLFMSTIESSPAGSVDDRSEAARQELSNAYGGLKVVLHLLQILLSSKAVLESSQTAFIVTKDIPETSVDYFEPHNFLVRLRLAALPTLKALWEAPWLIHAPLSVSRSIVHAILELLSGDGEEGAIAAIDTLNPVNVLAVPNLRTNAPDESAITQLTDMGFPRSAVERALTRTRNNVAAATEILLLNPVPYLPDPEPAEPPAAAPADEPMDQDQTTGPENSAATDSTTPTETNEQIEPVPQQKTTAEYRKELNEAREPIQKGLTQHAHRLLDEHEDLFFDLCDAFIKVSDEDRQTTVRRIIEDIGSYSPHAYDVQEHPMSIRCRLLALILNETPSALPSESWGSLMDNLLALLLSNPSNMDVDRQSTPKWLAPQLLVVETLLTLADQSTTVQVPQKDEPIPSHDTITVGPSFSEARNIVFESCMRFLKIETLGKDDLVSLLRLLVLLTRQHDLAAQFAKRDGLKLVFSHVKGSPVPTAYSYVAIILRHLVEDTSVLQKIMKNGMRQLLSQSSGRMLDASSFVKQCIPMALRNPHVFLDTTEQACRLSDPYVHNYISSKEESKAQPLDSSPAVGSESNAGPSDASQNPFTAPVSTSSPQTEALESTLHFLVGELMQTSSDVTSKTSPSTAPAASDTNPQREQEPGSEPVPAPETSSTPQDTTYPVFLMQCLTELLFSYDVCKVAFLSYSPKKRSSIMSKDTKFRNVSLGFLLNEFVSFGSLSPRTNAESRNRLTLCHWAMSVITALCVDTSLGHHEAKELSTDLVAVRKFVLETLSRAIKDTSGTEDVESRYGRLLALTDLCHHLLVVRFSSLPSRKVSDDTSTHLAKVMLEKNFVPTLSGVLGEVDLNYPNARNLVISILRPMEIL
jgi:E3 ubiquitin-protein ligase HUWE1